MSDEFSELKRHLASMHQILFRRGITSGDTLGHASARLPGGQVAYIKPSSLGFDEVSPQSLLGMDLDGKKLSGEGKLHLEIPIHNEIYKLRPDVNCVLHAHPFHATLLSAVWKGKMLLVDHPTIHFVDGVSVYDSCRLICSKEQGQEVAQTLGEGQVVLLKNHGVVVAAETIQLALHLALELENAARAHLLMAPFAGLDEVPRETAVLEKQQFLKAPASQKRFEYFCRQLDRQNPERSCSARPNRR